MARGASPLRTNAQGRVPRVTCGEKHGDVQVERCQSGPLLVRLPRVHPPPWHRTAMPQPTGSHFLALAEPLGLLHNAERSGTARATVSALLCVRGVAVPHGEFTTVWELLIRSGFSIFYVRAVAALVVISTGSSGRSNSAAPATWLMRYSSMCVQCPTRPGPFDRSSIPGLRMGDPGASTGRPNSDLRRDGHPLITPLGIAVRKSPCVGLARDERPRAFFLRTQEPFASLGTSADPGFGEEHPCCASVRLAQLLGGIAASDPLCEVAFIELLQEQQLGVSRVFSAPHGATGFHVDGRMLCGLYLLTPITSDGRFGEYIMEGCWWVWRMDLPWEARTRKWRKRCRCRPSAAEAAPARRQSATAFQEELRELITGLSQRPVAIERVPSGHRQVPRPQVRPGISTPLMKLRTITPPRTGTALGRARKCSGDAKTSLLPMCPPTIGRTTQSPSTHEPTPEPHAILTSSLGRSATALEKGRARSSPEAYVGPAVSCAERRRARWAEHGRRWQQQQAMRPCLHGHRLPPRERRAGEREEVSNSLKEKRKIRRDRLCEPSRGCQGTSRSAREKQMQRRGKPALRAWIL